MPPSIKLEYFFLISWVIPVGRIMQAFNCVTQLNYLRNYLYSVANLDCSIPSFRRIKTGSISEDEDTIDFLLSTASPGEEKIGGKVQRTPFNRRRVCTFPPPPPPPATSGSDKSARGDGRGEGLISHLEYSSFGDAATAAELLCRMSPFVVVRPVVGKRQPKMRPY